MSDQMIRVLLIEDDEDDYVLTRDLLSEVPGCTFHLEWTPSFEEALDKAQRGGYDVCLLDYRLGERDGLDLLHELHQAGCRVPIIMLSGQGGHEVDMQAMGAGAVDYLEKDGISASMLERTIRYAIERRRVETALRESEKQLKILSSKLLEAQETERKLVAQELHDGITGSLVGIKFSLESKLLQMGRGMEPPGISIERIVGMVEGAIEEVGRISTRLRPAMLDNLGVLATMSWFCQEFQETYQRIYIEEQIEVAEDEVPGDLKVVIYRVFQEALNNIAKHSGADRVTLCLRKGSDNLELCVTDNGQGFEMQKVIPRIDTPGGMGLTSMKERTEFSGGSFEISSTKGEGAGIRATWKLNENH
jgi:signal transduction histidine kinase